VTPPGELERVTGELERATGKLEKATGELERATGELERAIGKLEKATARPVETRNVCKTCGHVNPEWIRNYCVRCAAKL
jgi:hypothetical protein